MKWKPQRRLFYTEKHVNKMSNFQTSQKMLEIQVKEQVDVLYVGKHLKGKTPSGQEICEICGRIKNYDGEGRKVKEK